MFGSLAAKWTVSRSYRTSVYDWRLTDDFGLPSSTSPSSPIRNETANEQSWCLECVTSDPWITSAYRQSAIDGHPVTLVQARVGTKEAWESQSHPYRKFVKSVPTLVRWTKAGPQNRLDKFGDLTSLDSLKEFFESK